MNINDVLIFGIALFMVIKGATLATTYAARLAESFRMSKYTVGFLIVAVISILPETFISINAALTGIPSFGLGMLFGSNIADLTLVFAIIIFITGRGLKIESKILKNHRVYPFILLVPLLLGFDGYFTRLEGATLIITGAAFYYVALKNGMDGTTVNAAARGARYKSILMLLFSMVVLLVGSHLVVVSATSLATSIGVSPILIGMLVVGLGTTMPELLFSLKSVKKQEDSLAVGDVLGTVLADATIVVGIIAIISPFAFPTRIIYITGAFMVGASFLLFHFMSSGRTLTKKEAVSLFIFWIAFVLVEFVANS